MPKLIILQTKKDHDAEKYNNLRFFWWVFSSILFTLLTFFFSKPLEYALYIFIGFLTLFIWQDLTKNKKTKARINFFLGILYLLWGILFIYYSIMLTRSEGLSISLAGFIIAFVFLMLGYKKIDRHSNLFKRLFKRKHKKKNSWERVNKPMGWVFRKARRRKSNIVNGEHYKYKIVRKGRRKIVYRKRR